MPSILGRRRVAGDNLVWYTGDHFRILDAVGPDVIHYFEDFTNTPVASDAISGWTTTLVEGGNGETTVTSPDGSGGILLLTTDDAENDGPSLQITSGECYSFSSSQALTYFGIRMKTGEATQSDFLVGLCITNTALLGGMTDGVYFRKVDGSTATAFVTEKDSSETATAAVHTVAADTYVTYEFCFDGTRIYAWVDGTKVATHTATIPDDELLVPSIEFLTGNTAIETMTVDWIRVVQIGR